MSDVLAMGDWKTNADTIAEVAQLGYEMTAHVVPWCHNCGLPEHGPYVGPVVAHPPICSHPGCIEELHPRRRGRPPLYCPIHLRLRRVERSRIYYSRFRRSGMTRPPFPVAALRRRGDLVLALSAHRDIPQEDARSMVKRLGTYIDAYAADEWAVIMGVHPSEIWPEWWIQTELVSA